MVTRNPTRVSLPRTLSPLAIAVLKTLAYGDVFQYPLTAKEVFTYLISSQPFPPAEVDQMLNYLVQEARVSREGEFFFLRDRRELVPIRRRRQAASQIKWRKARRWTLFLKLCPWVKLVGVSGALAMDNSEAEDDLDLFFITSLKRVWLTRVVIVLFFFLTGQYRRPTRISGRFCPNLFLTEAALGGFGRNLFIAHEIVQLRLLWEREGLYQRFLSRNSWVNRLLPHVAIPSSLTVARPPRPFLAGFFDSLEKWAKKLQLAFMAKRRTSEVTTDNLLRFHPRETTNLVLRAYEERLRHLGLLL